MIQNPTTGEKTVVGFLVLYVKCNARILFYDAG